MTYFKIDTSSPASLPSVFPFSPDNRHVNKEAKKTFLCVMRPDKYRWDMPVLSENSLDGILPSESTLKPFMGMTRDLSVSSEMST